MSTSFTINCGNIIAEFDVESDQIYGSGCAEFPILGIRLNFLFRAHNASKNGMDFIELRGRIESKHKRLGFSQPTHLDIRLESGKELTNYSVYMEFPLDLKRLDLLNKQRNGGDVHLTIHLELLSNEIAWLNPKDTQQSAWGITYRHRSYSKVELKIPRSEWLEKILPGTGFGKTYLVELPIVSIESCEKMKSAFENLQTAQALENQGFYKESVSKCRTALEAFIEQKTVIDDKGKEKKIPKLKASWETRLGERTYNWLDSSLSVIKGEANKAAHLSPKHFTQLEAQMLLLVTTSLLAYAVQNMPESES